MEMKSHSEYINDVQVVVVVQVGTSHIMITKINHNGGDIFKIVDGQLVLELAQKYEHLYLNQVA
jgi:hypothetical protein